MRFFKCRNCNKVVEVIEEGSQILTCCGEEMVEIIPNVVEASREKHLPVYSVNDDKVYVRIGEVMHPMEEAHSIKLIIAETKNEIIRKKLNPNDVPEVVFDFEEGMKIYTYCNLHGLWMTQVRV